jgi:hypothetical protein
MAAPIVIIIRLTTDALLAVRIASKYIKAPTMAAIITETMSEGASGRPAE